MQVQSFLDSPAGSSSPPRTRVREENRTASSRIQPGGGASGPFTCLSGFVWREAFEGDLVCVTPEVRTLVREENRQAASRRVGG